MNADNLMRQATMTVGDYFLDLSIRLPDVSDEAIALMTIACAVDLQTSVMSRLELQKLDQD